MAGSRSRDGSTSGRSGKLPGTHSVFVVTAYQWGRCPTRVGAEVAIGRCAAPSIMPRMASSDPAYKLLFSQPRMVEDTLRGYVAPHWCEELDFSTLTRMNAEYIGPELYNRIGDMLWRVEFREDSPLGGPPLDNGERPLPARPVRVPVRRGPRHGVADARVRLPAATPPAGQRDAEGGGTGSAGAGGGGVQRGPCVDGGGCAFGAGGGWAVGVGVGGEPDTDLRGARRAGVGGRGRWTCGKRAPTSWKSMASWKPPTAGTTG